MTDAEIQALREQYDRATSGRWAISHDRLKQAIIVDTQGRVIVEADTYAEDIKLIAMMHEQIPQLLAEVERARAAELATRHELERAHGEHMDTLQAALLNAEATKQDLERFAGKANTLGQAAELATARLANLHAEQERTGPLVSAVERWVRTRHSPNLLAAWDRYQEQCKTGSPS